MSHLRVFDCYLRLFKKDEIETLAVGKMILHRFLPEWICLKILSYRCESRNCSSFGSPLLHFDSNSDLDFFLHAQCSSRLSIQQSLLG